MATWAPGDAIPDFGGGRNLTQTDKLVPALGDVLAGMDTAIVAGVAASLGTSAPAATGLAAADDGVAAVASKEDHVHQISAALAALIVGSVTFAAAAETGGDMIALTVQVKDALGTNLARRTRVLIWLSDTDVSTVGTAVTTAVAATGGGTVVKAHTAGLVLDCETNASGALVLELTIAGAASRFANASAGGVNARSTEILWAA